MGVILGIGGEDKLPIRFNFQKKSRLYIMVAID